MSLYADGSTIANGSPYNDENGDDLGQVELIVKGQAGNGWSRASTATMKVISLGGL